MGENAELGWCPDFQPAIHQMLFSLSRDSSWDSSVGASGGGVGVSSNGGGGGGAGGGGSSGGGGGGGGGGSIHSTPLLHSKPPTLRKIPLHAILAEDRRWKLKGLGQRVLVVGETGYGKTTLMLRLLSDWSTQVIHPTSSDELQFSSTVNTFDFSH